ncbi:hypothetical protein [Treponema pedis]|uniref:Lipopolysaccharide assembly protein A domain-containing protein n=1 Tax=Treponema pedis str. T A4 TaxID=1291379 RepID=S5ZUS4_9SPIR|nr:hypothetical protein [Treponema pedis]AGT43950.1 hypothetical protein TPE_1455 [Treponema pedis str. T A4]
MPWKVIYFLFIILAFALFAGFNMNNTCDVSLVFYTLKTVPVYVINLFSFLIGIVLTVPFFWGNKKRNVKAPKHQGFSSAATDNEVSGIKNVDLKPQKRTWFWNKKKVSGGESAGFSSDA